MIKKRLVSVLVLCLLVFSTFTVAQETADENVVDETCSGFFGRLGCWLFGSSEARAGKGWFDREDALAGKAGCQGGDYFGYACWHEQGFTDKEKRDWAELGLLNAIHANKFRARGFTPEFTKKVGYDIVNQWVDKDDPPRLLVERGWTPTQVDTIGGEEVALAWGTIPPASAVVYTKQRYWTNQDIQAVGGPLNAATYASAGLTPEQGAFLRSNGLTPAQFNRLDPVQRQNLITKAQEQNVQIPPMMFIVPPEPAPAAPVLQWTQAMPSTKELWKGIGGGLSDAQAQALYDASNGDLDKAKEALRKANNDPTKATEALETESKAAPTQPAAPTQSVPPAAKKAGAEAPAAPVLPVPPATPAEAPKEEEEVSTMAAQISPIAPKTTKQALLEWMQAQWIIAQGALGEKMFGELTKTNMLLYPTNTYSGNLYSGFTGKGYVYPLRGGGTITAEISDKGNVVIYRVTPGQTLGSVDSSQTLRKDGVTIATQTNEEWLKNTLVVNGETLKVAKGTDVNALTSGKAVPFFSEKGEKIGETQVAGDQVVITNFDEGTQKILNTKTGETLDLIGDYYKKGNQFLPSGGTWTTTETTADGNVRQVKYVLDHDYKGTGEDKKLSKVDVYDFQGNRVGAQFDNNRDNKPDISYIQQGNEMIIKDAFGIEVQRFRNIDGTWTCVTLYCMYSEHGVTNENLNAAYTSPGTKGTRTALQTIYALTQSFKDYPAISKLLFGESAAYQNWQRKSDELFAPLLSSNWAVSSFCETATAFWKDDIPQGKAVIRTASDTYQAVASIQMEKSEKKSPILCQKNPDEEADEQWICDSGQVCVDEQFCYADEDDEKPLQGYFYKITWAVTAPRDEALTLYKDENGVAVSFNIVLNSGNIPLYNRMGNLVSPIMLENGASDKDAIIKYSPKEYNQACIVWHQAPSTFSSAAAVAYGTTPIGEVCFNVVTSSAGRVEWEQAGQSSASVSENKGEISRNSNW